MRRELVTGLGGVCLGFALGVGVRGCGDGDVVAPPPRERKPEVEAATAADAVPRETRRRAKAQEAADEHDMAAAEPSPSAAPVAVSADVKAIALPDAPSGWAELEVVVLDAEQRPAANVLLQALPAGPRPAPGGSSSYHDFAHGETNAQGCGRILVPSPGRYEIRAQKPYWTLRALDIAVPETRLVRFVEPARAALTVVLEAPEVVDLSIEPVPGHSVSGMDGTTAVPHSIGARKLFPQQPRIVIPLLRGSRWRLSSDGFLVSPSEVQAPAEVVVRGGGPGTLKITGRVESSEPASAVERCIRFDYRVEGEPLLEGCARVPPGEALGGQQFALPWLYPRASRGTLRWSGSDVEPGSAAFDLGTSHDLAIVVSVPHVSSTDANSARVVIRYECPTASTETTLNAVLWDSAQPENYDDARLRALVEHVLREAGRWLIVLPRQEDGSDKPDDRLSGPVLLRAGARHELTYRRGGFVVIVPRGTPPRDAGAIEILRTDGGPLLGEDAGREVTPRIRIKDGTVRVLGPFEPGTVTLDVHVGHVCWARYEVTIRAGEHTALPIGPFGEGPR